MGPFYEGPARLRRRRSARILLTAHGAREGEGPASCRSCANEALAHLKGANESGTTIPCIRCGPSPDPPPLVNKNRVVPGTNWLGAIEDTTLRLEEGAPRTRVWFQLDREADAWPQLLALTESGHDFTVRASWNRRGHSAKGTRYLRDIVKKKRILGTYNLPVPASPGRSERVARMAVRVAIVVAAIQYVRKVSGLRVPSRADTEAFERAVAEIAEATSRLLSALPPRGEARTREGEREKARAKWRVRVERS